MAHAFADGSVGLWSVDPTRTVNRRHHIAEFANGQFSDIFLPRTATLTQMETIRNTIRPNNLYMRAQLWMQVDGLSPIELAARINDDISRLKPGCVEIDVELGNDADLNPYITKLHANLRNGFTFNGKQYRARPSFLFRIDSGAQKQQFMPASLFKSDPAFYYSPQSYYGDMSPVNYDETLRDAIKAGIPEDKISVCYGAAGPTGFDPERVCTLGTIFYQSQLIGYRRIRRGLVFQDDLMVEVGLLPYED